MTSVSLTSLSPNAPANLQASGISARSHKSQAVPKGNAEKPNQSDDVSDWDHEFKSKSLERDQPSVQKHAKNSDSSTNKATKKTQSDKSSSGNKNDSGAASTRKNDSSSNRLNGLLDRQRSKSLEIDQDGVITEEPVDDRKQHPILAPNVAAVLMLNPTTSAAISNGDAISNQGVPELASANALTTGLGEDTTRSIAVTNSQKPETQGPVQENAQSPATFSLQMAQSEQPANSLKSLPENANSSATEKAPTKADDSTVPQSLVAPAANGQVGAVQAGSENKQQDSNGEGQRSAAAVSEKPAKKNFGENKVSADNGGIVAQFSQANPTSLSNLITKQNVSAANSSQATVPINSAEDAVQTGPVKEMTVRFQDDAGRTVSVRLADQAGEVRVSVRSSDPAAATALRQEMPGLSASLERVGWRLTSSESGPQMPAASETSHQSGDEQNPDRQRQSSDWQQNSDRRRSSGFDQWDQLFTRQ